MQKFKNLNVVLGWGDHAEAGYITGYTEKDTVFNASAAKGITGAEITNWNMAYSWGNHATAGYLTSYTENDPSFAASPVSSITGAQITSWDTAYGWGNHAAAGYLTSYTETDPVYLTSPASGITATQITNWDSAYSWGDHSIAGYAKDYKAGTVACNRNVTTSVAFTTPFTDTNYVIVITPEDVAGQTPVTFIVEGTKTVNGFSFQRRNGAADATNICHWLAVGYKNP